jgi:hypothetical protein
MGVKREYIRGHSPLDKLNKKRKGRKPKRKKPGRPRKPKKRGRPTLKKPKKRNTDKSRREALKASRVVPESKLCVGYTKEGNPCKGSPITNSKFCNAHTPGFEKRMKRRAGGDHLDSPFESIKDIKKDGKPFSLADYPFLVAIYMSVAPYIAIIKSAQMGLTEYALQSLIWFIRRFGKKERRRIIWTFPTASDASDFSKDRVDSIVDENISLFGKAEQKKKWTDNVRMKQIANSVIFIRGTQGKAGFTSTPSDLNIHDEVNFSDPVIMSKFASRLDASKWQWVRWLSTPTFPGEGIDAKFHESCMNHWYVPCSECGDETPFCCQALEAMDIENNKWICQKCGGELDRAKGRWVPKVPELCGLKDGWHVTRPMMLKETPRSIMKKKDDYKKEQDFYNFVLGLTFDSVANIISKMALASCTNGKFRFHTRVDRPCTLGIDQGGKWIHLVVSTWDRKGRRQIVWAQKVDVEEAYASVLPLIMRQFNIIIGVIDGQPNLQSAKKFAKEHEGVIFVHAHADKQFKEIVWHDDELRVTTNKTQMMDMCSEEIYKQKIIWPDNDTMTEFKKHVRNMRRRAGEEDESAHWVNVGADHFNDANMFDHIAKIRATELINPQVVISTVGVEEEESSMDLLHGLLEVGNVEEIFSYYNQKFSGKYVADMVLSEQAKSVFVKLEKVHGVKKVLELTQPSPQSADTFRKLLESRNDAEKENAQVEEPEEEDFDDIEDEENSDPGDHPGKFTPGLKVTAVYKHNKPVG